MSAMFVCVCKAITDKDIAQAVENGADSLRDVRRALNLGSQCGKCVVEAADIVKQSKANLDLAYEAAC